MQNLKQNLYLLILLIPVLIAIKIRILNPWDSVFTFTVRLAENDPWYYYRLIENCIHNFPSRIWFDPMTQYPYGTYTHFGPFLVYLSVAIAMLSGATSGEALRSFLVFIPAIGGLLTIFAVFFLTRSVFNVRTAIISALLISIIPGQFLHRSMLSFNDHHIWEIFWMCLSFAFFILLLKGEWNRKSILCAVFGGISFGMYILSWAAGFTFGLLVVSALFLALILKFKIPETTYKLTFIYFISAILVYLPFSFNAPSNPVLYSPMQLSMLIFYAIATLFLWQFDLKFTKIEKVVRIGKETALILIAIIGLILISYIFPQLSYTIGTITGYLQPKGGALTIGEVYPFFTQGGSFNLFPAYYHFGMTFFFAIPAMVFLGYRIYRNRDLKDFTIFLWAIALFIALCGQNRFAYYFALVSAIYAGLALDILFGKLHLYKIFEEEKGKKRGRKNLSYFRITLAILLGILAVYPTYSLAEMQSVSAGALNHQWFSSMVWLRNNTPSNGYEEYYYELYTPGKPGEKYPYPFETYGVLSWWDYGHWILAIGKRMAVANPFQQGIGNFYDNVSGAAPFFVTSNESYAESVAEELNVRYVVSDIEMATGKFYAMATWAEGDLEIAYNKYYDGYLFVTPQGTLGIGYGYQIPPNSFVPLRVPSEAYYNSMEAKLHMLDGSGLSHYRLIYESEPSDEWKYYSAYLGTYSPMEIALQDSFQRARYGVLPSFSAQEIMIKFVYKNLYQNKTGIPVDLNATGYVKIFERVKGVKVTGNANSEFVEVNATILTNQGRIFEYYKKEKVINGTYEIILPYSHDSVYKTKPITPYTFKAGKIIKTLMVSESQVQKGEVISLDLTQ
ncbi:MAG: oligosaccharyl transferase, archaeosortase A system-associated [Archaeoglobaceae archaeon]|nr:oligosaccharyl transferase, archaeosortase A system-associated [Archaeoglobaceae archaeon]MDW8127767.1 oligosaccharyl transferase, archaeosortase A system-associated [Archaeoglobaceae archaeon]